MSTSRIVICNSPFGTSSVFPMLVLVAFSWASSSCSQDEHEVVEQQPARKYYAADGFIFDHDGEVLLLKGINISGRAKYEADFLLHLGDDDIQVLLDSGINSVRLLTFWCAISPDAAHEFDEDYLNGLVENAQKLQDAGLYMVLDMHQDLWGQPFEKHGAPQWACPDELKEGYEPSSPWWVNYTKPQVKACFDNFYSSEDLTDAYAAALAKAAGALCHMDNLLGFDLFNEPYPGSSFGDAGFDNQVLLPVYLKVMDAVEQACPDRLFFLEPNISYQLGLSDPFVLPEDMKDRIVFAPHFYPSEVHEPDGAGYDGDRAALEERFMRLVTPFSDDGVPVWLGEYGGVTTNPGFGQYVQDLHRIMWEHHVSSALWDYTWAAGGFGFLDENKERKPVFDAVFHGPTFTSLPGVPMSMSVDWEHGSITASFQCSEGKCVEVSSGTRSICTSSDENILHGFSAGPGGTGGLCCKAQGQVTVSCTATE